MEGLRIKTPPVRGSEQLDRPPLPNKQGFFKKLLSYFSAKKAQDDYEVQSVKSEATLKDDLSDANHIFDAEEHSSRPPDSGRRSNSISVSARDDVSVTSSRRTREVKSRADKDGDEQQSVTWSEDRSRDASPAGGKDVQLKDSFKILREPPVWFDPVEDRVRSRWFSVLSFTCIISVLSTVLLRGVWDTSTVLKLDKRPVLKTLFASGNPMIIDCYPLTNMSFKVQALNRNGWPLRDITIAVHVVDFRLSPVVRSRLPFCDPTWSSTAHAASNQPVCQVSLVGSSVLTDRDGVADFKRLAFDAALPGAYRLEFYTAESALNASEWVTVKPAISSIEADPLASPGRESGTDIQFDNREVPMKLSSSPPALRVIAGGGFAGIGSLPSRGVPGIDLNVTVHAVGLDFRYDLNGSLEETIALDAEEMEQWSLGSVVLSGNTAQASTDGFVSFPNLSVLGYDQPLLLLAFVCHGEVFVWSQVQLQPAFNVSERAASSDGFGALATVAFLHLPAPLAASSPSSVSILSWPDRAVEGEQFEVKFQHPSSLDGAALVPRVRPLPSAVQTAELYLEGPSSIAFGEMRTPVRMNEIDSRFKILLGSPAVVLLGSAGSGRAAGTFRFSTFGAAGEYEVIFYLFGRPVASRQINVTSSVGLVTVGASPSLCGPSYQPVCRHAGGQCSFGHFFGDKLVPPSSPCQGLVAMTVYTSLELGQSLLWILVHGSSSNAFVPGKFVELQMVPWGVNVSLWSSYSVDMNPVVTSSKFVAGSGKYGSASLASFQLLVVPPSISSLQPCLRIDDTLYPTGIQVQASSMVLEAEAACSALRACAFIRTVVGVPDIVQAGEVLKPFPAARIVDARGEGLSGRLVCFIYGTAKYLEAATSLQAFVDDSVVPGLKNSTQASLGLMDIQEASFPRACNFTESTGDVTFTNLFINSSSTDNSTRTLWRFVALNAFSNEHISCLRGYSAWAPACASSVRSSLVRNPIARIVTGPTPLVQSATVNGQPSLLLDPSDFSSQSRSINFSIPVSCYDDLDALVPFHGLEVRMSHLWNSRSEEAVSMDYSMSVSTSELLISLHTTLAGVYVLELNAFNLRRRVFLRMRYSKVSAMAQLRDRNAFYSDFTPIPCVWDCDAKNVSNIGQVHPQDLRFSLLDQSGKAVEGAQVYLLLECVSQCSANAGQLSGIVSLQSALHSDGETYAHVPSLSLSAARPGTYRFQVFLFGPSWQSAASQTSKLHILTSEFTVMDQVYISYSTPPFNLLPGRADMLLWNKTALGAGGGGGEEILAAVSVRIQRWSGNTAFLYPSAWRPPVLTVQMAGLAVGTQPGAGDTEVVNVTLQGLQLGYARAASTGSPLLASSSILGMSRTLRFGWYSFAIGGEGVTRDVETLLDNSSLWLPEGQGYLLSPPFGVSEKPFLLSIISRIPQVVGQGQEFLVRVQARLANGQPLEGVTVEAEIAVECTAEDASYCGPLQFKTVSGGPSPQSSYLFKDQVLITTVYTTRLILLTTTGFSLNASTDVTDTNGVADVLVVLGRAQPGRYRIRFRNGGTFSDDSDPFLVTNLVASINISVPLVGTAPGLSVPKRSLGPYDFNLGSSFVSLPSVYTITGVVGSQPTITSAQVRVLDSSGNALRRSSEVSLHIVTCGQDWVEPGTLVFPPNTTSGCEEFVDWNLTQPPSWVCEDGACDRGYTLFAGVNFFTTAETGFYYVFFASDGYVASQAQPLYASNLAIPAASELLSYRLVLMLGLGGMILLLNANIVDRSRVWIQLSLLGCIVFAIVSALYFRAVIASYGSPSKVQQEIVLCGGLMVINTFAITIILLRLVVQTDSLQYFTYRQKRYLTAFRNLLVSPEAREKKVKRTWSMRRKKNRVHPKEEEVTRASSSSHGPMVHGHNLGSNEDGKAQAEATGLQKRREILRKENAKDREIVLARKASTEEAMARQKKVRIQDEKEVKREVVELEGFWGLLGILADYGKELVDRLVGEGGGRGGSFETGFNYPVRLLQGFGMSACAVFVLLVALQSLTNRVVFGLERLRAEVVRYREALGNYQTSVSSSSSMAAYPTAPYSNRYDIVALSYTVMESIYGDGPAFFEQLLSSMLTGTSAGQLAIIASFLWAWLQIFRSYRRMMMQLRADHTLIRVWHFPIHDASGYVGRQLWSSLVSAMLVFIPVFFLVSFLLWQPTQRFFVFFVFLPLGGLALIELGCWGLRAWVNSIAVSGIYIRSRRIYGVYDFIGLYLHFLTGPALAVLRVLFTYADFAINFCRLDIPVLEGSLANFDPGHAAFMAMLYLDFFYNAPVTSVMAYNLSNALYRRRELKQISEAVGASKSILPFPFLPFLSGYDCLLLPF
ncbi:hypothetical protein GUITHDRAFT_103531 [Guillardia theta CCMP2712]|uniref:Uncharacterized protein n=1 Tax=Guillardia theta (strain CCMP2712) TaxID=905079 RepID=L1JRY4_GUITC|nr:hypothetical protein GUITHDRAFT_103531 [Guillardia theta CCMP2712]EKX50950.1 hypothetical protein GUITHDRAFT_103531 [Guillardia theta CCMP2712]|eukprot:XP_005837930.1 hypothetical protein GUITHDRAFT_103531 [Guillardia theta CCMP2712]